jgi:predicted O-methyltransferase YrrM
LSRGAAWVVKYPGNFSNEVHEVLTKARIQFAQVPADTSQTLSPLARAWQHSFFAWAGLRPIKAQHTLSEHQALMRYARGAKSVVEIGVAEGASAAGLREAMPQDGTLYLIDPFHLSRVRALNFLRRAAQHAVESAGNGRTIWMEAFSQDAVREWKLPIDLLLIDGDHREEAVERDWQDWSPFVVPEGVVVFHDARLFPSGWTASDNGPVRFVDRFFRGNSSSPWNIIEEVDSLVFVSRKKPA